MDFVADLPGSMPLFQGPTMYYKKSEFGVTPTFSMCDVTTVTSANSFESIVGMVVKKPKKTTETTVPQIAKPKRPLTAYNLFFRSERAKMIGAKETSEKLETESPQDKKKRPHRKTHGKVGFQEMAKVVGQRWKQLDKTAKAVFEKEAAGDIKRYRKDMEVYRQTMHIMGLDCNQAPNKKKSQPCKVTSSKNHSMFVPAVGQSCGQFTTGRSTLNTQHWVPTMVSSSSNITVKSKPDGPITPSRRRDILQKALEICQTEDVATPENCPQPLSKRQWRDNLENDLKATFDDEINSFSLATLKPTEVPGNVTSSAPPPSATPKELFPPKHELDLEPIDLSFADDFEDSCFFDTLGESFGDIFEDRNVKRRLNKCDNTSSTKPEGLWSLLVE